MGILQETFGPAKWRSPKGPLFKGASFKTHVDRLPSALLLLVSDLPCVASALANGICGAQSQPVPTFQGRGGGE